MRLLQIKRILVLLVSVSWFGTAQAGIITIQWDTTVEDTDFADVSVGESASLVVRFNALSNDLANLVVDATNFIDYSIRFSASGEFATWSVAAPATDLTLLGPNLFEFNNLGELSSVNEFFIEGNDYLTSINGLSDVATLYNDGENCILCSNVGDIDVFDVDFGLNPQAWSVTTQVPEPSTLVIFALAVIGLVTRRNTKLIAI
ncbi:PEP-CTERM sorting domain-containing protein [Alginatibacterium sediminis]|uniref:PEP-CTERM sorting domain-containing protein n=1 Tax=Alginatibacterium sediminis TaxID=2164068 RepID=A0A420EH06_9ALTE|nr:PEP-CTERM sorting domain-containing protein [Alginatibacterium sediminis]RKF19957.1 PEP-CTERM sorting domain-containing protein [Alginatibacterium sediminis]